MNPQLRYNIRGWLTDINNVKQDIFGKDATPGTSDDLFAFRINYNFIEAPGNGISGSMAIGLLNGNIAETYWKTSTDNTLRGYGYVYDEMNRLLHAQYVKPDALTPYPQNYDETLSYDKNGNIMTLLRKSGVDIPTGAMLTDNLTYTYESNGNKLLKVADATNSETGFKDGTNLGNDYAYDDNGNMISDANKEINQILYNHLNLPTSITFANGSSIEYFYNAAGQKLRKTVNDTQNNTVKEVDYMDGFQYAGGVLQFFPHAEGYVAATQGTKTDSNGNFVYIFNYVNNYTDHLGNIRLSYTKDPVSGELEIMEENHYYPFGLKHDVYAPPQQKYELDEEDENLARPAFVFETEYQYKYNGKEWQDELGLGWYDYQARNYDPALGRWMNVDPLAEVSRRFSPYAYALNNPVYFIDPDGMMAENNGSSGQVWSGIAGINLNSHEVSIMYSASESGDSNNGDPKSKKNNDPSSKKDGGLAVQSKEKPLKPKGSPTLDKYKKNNSSASKPSQKQSKIITHTTKSEFPPIVNNAAVKVYNSTEKVEGDAGEAIFDISTDSKTQLATISLQKNLGPLQISYPKMGPEGLGAGGKVSIYDLSLEGTLNSSGFTYSLHQQDLENTTNSLNVQVTPTGMGLATVAVIAAFLAPQTIISAFAF